MRGIFPGIFTLHKGPDGPWAKLKYSYDIGPRRPYVIVKSKHNVGRITSKVWHSYVSQGNTIGCKLGPKRPYFAIE